MLIYVIPTCWSLVRPFEYSVPKSFLLTTARFSVGVVPSGFASPAITFNTTSVSDRKLTLTGSETSNLTVALDIGLTASNSMSTSTKRKFSQ